MNDYLQPDYIDSTEDPGEASAPEQPKKKRSAVNLLLGLLVILLAGYGVFQLAHLGISRFKEKNAEKETADTAVFYEYLIPAAAVDIDPFEDITAANMDTLVEMAVWAVLNSGMDPTQYQFDSDELLLPEAQVEAAFIHFFGTERTVAHTTVEGYGYRFTYDAAGRVYRIPLTTITPLYTPLITETETKGDSTVLTVGYLNAGLYAMDKLTGQLTAPEPDKYVKVTLRAASTGTYISAVRSLAISETAATLPVYTTADPDETETEPEEDTGTDGETKEDGETEEAGEPEEESASEEENGD